MQAITTHHPHPRPMRGWRHAVAHAQARLEHLRLRTTMGPFGPVDGYDGVTPTLRDYPYRPER